MVSSQVFRLQFRSTMENEKGKFYRSVFMDQADQKQLKNRLNELADRAYNTGQYTFTDFLNLAEISTFQEMKRELSYASPDLFGGTPECERCIVGFGSEEELGYPKVFPIRLLEVSAMQEKFADKLTHRDFLGSVLGLGITREKVGDIFLIENRGYIFVHESVSDFIRESLGFVKHTHVSVTELSEIPEELAPKLLDQEIIVSGNRIDSVIAKLYHLSREEAQTLVKKGEVFINGRETLQTSKELKPGDIISVRHHGRFLFVEEGNRTKKDRLYLHLQIYS